MKILLINSVCGTGSTGRICTDMAQQFEKEGHTVKIAYGRHAFVPEKFQKYAVRIGTDFDVKFHALQTRLFDTHGFGSKRATKKFLQWADEFNPDLVWLHNIHGYYINVEMLFDWLKKRPNTLVKWTLHDCWAFTGHCTHFTVANCEKWQAHCQQCPQLNRYPASIRDNSATNFDRKKAAFTGVKNMTLITPSKWLANLVKQSFLKDYPIEVVYNTIDKTIFKPTPSDFRQKYGLENKKIILGVASTWDEHKGLNDFIKLSQMLDDKYAVVLVGLTEKQIKALPKQIKGLKRTNNAQDLAPIYSAADMFVNPSKEETFGMTTLEAVACGVQKTIVYADTACEEIAQQDFGGSKIIPQGVEHIYEAITGQKYESAGGGGILLG